MAEQTGDIVSTGRSHSPVATRRTGSLDWALDGQTWPNHVTSRFVEAAGLRWHVQISGTGPVVLLLHGTGASTHSWRGLLPLLVNRFTVVAPDLPGHGFTGRPSGTGMSLPGIAERVAALLAVLDVKPSLVVGHSAGAAIMVRMVFDGVIAPAALFALNGALLPIGGVAGQVFAPLARVLSSSRTVPRIFARLAGDPDVVDRLLRQTGSRLDRDGLAFYERLARSPEHMAGALSMMAHWDLTAIETEIAHLAIPLTLVVGDRDGTILPADAHRIRRRLPAARIVTLRGLGHLAHEERPGDVADLIEIPSAAAPTCLHPE